MKTMELHIRADKSGPEPPRDERGHLTQPWPIAGVELVGEPQVDHELSADFVTDGVQRGWIETQGARPFVYKTPRRVSTPAGIVASKTEVRDHYDTIILRVDSGDLVYDVVQNPGPYDPETGELVYGVTEHTAAPDRYEVFHGYRVHLRGAK